MQFKATHALQASERCLIDLQKVLFQRVTNALLKSNQAPFTSGLITSWSTAGYELDFLHVFFIFTDDLFEIM